MDRCSLGRPREDSDSFCEYKSLKTIFRRLFRRNKCEYEKQKQDEIEQASELGINEFYNTVN
jgi:hypothetical protein